MREARRHSRRTLRRHAWNARDAKHPASTRVTCTRRMYHSFATRSCCSTCEGTRLPALVKHAKVRLRSEALWLLAVLAALLVSCLWLLRRALACVFISWRRRAFCPELRRVHCCRRAGSWAHVALRLDAARGWHDGRPCRCKNRGGWERGAVPGKRVLRDGVCVCVRTTFIPAVGYTASASLTRLA